METEHLQACWNSKFKEWTGENAVSVQTKTKWLVVMHVMKSANCGLARRLKNGRWIALWSHWKHTGMKKWQIKKYINEVYSDIFKLKNTKMNWQKCGSVQTEVKLLVTSHPNYWWLDEPWSLASSSETATSNMPIFWVWVMRNQWLWRHLPLSILRERRERSIKRQSSRNSLTQWIPDAALIGRMAETWEGVGIMDSG